MFILQLKVEQHKYKGYMYVKIIIIILSILRYVLKVHNVTTDYKYLDIGQVPSVHYLQHSLNYLMISG